MLNKFRKWWLFSVANPVVRRGEQGGFKWVFRRFTLDISTVSGNFSCRFVADEHPYAYLLAGKTDDNIHGFCQMLYFLGKTLTTDQKLVNDIGKAVKKYNERLGKVDPEKDGEEISLEYVKGIQEHTELSRAERRRRDREIDKRFRKAIRDGEKNAK